MLGKCPERAGIPRQVHDNLLESKVLSVFEKVGSTIDPGFIDDSHYLGKNNDRVIIKFSRRKDCRQIFRAKKDLKESSTDDMD